MMMNFLSECTVLYRLQNTLFICIIVYKTAMKKLIITVISNGNFNEKICSIELIDDK
jgi:hypothetical protein